MSYVYCSKTGKLNSENSNLPSMDTFLSQLHLFPISKHIFPALIFFMPFAHFLLGYQIQSFPYAFPTKTLYASLSTCSCHCSVLYFTRQAMTQIVHCNETVPRHFLRSYDCASWQILSEWNYQTHWIPTLLVLRLYCFRQEQDGT